MGFKPATKARQGINPFTKEETVFKARPARNVVKVLPLKAWKDMAITELHIRQILNLPIAYMIGGQVWNVDLSRATWQIF